MNVWNDIDTKGRRSGKIQTTCPACSHTRKKKNAKCLSVDLNTGHYHCSHCGIDGWRPNDKPIKTEPVNLPKLNTTELSDKTFKYLNKVRMLSSVTIKRNNITEGEHYIPQVSKKRNCIWFNYFVDGVHVNTKFRDGEKNFTQVGGAEKHFYKIDDIKGSDYAICCEGEIDSLSWEEAGHISAVSVPDGALPPTAEYTENKLKYVDNDIDKFDGCERIYLSIDNDAPGLHLRKELSRRFGRERCWIIDLGDYKDANEVLQDLGRVDGIEYLKQAFDNATPWPIDGMKTVAELSDNVLDLYENGIDSGVPLGLYGFDELAKIIEGWLYVWTGIPSHGKSTFLTYILLLLIKKREWKIAIYSPEHPPEMVLQNFAKMYLEQPFWGSRRMHKDDLKAVLRWLNEHVYFIMPKDDYSLDNILEISKQLVKQKGVRALVIDPWNTLDHQLPKGMDKNDYISKNLTKLNIFKQAYGCSVHLVAHPTKMPKEENGKYKVPTGYNISDSAHFYNKADFGLTVYRDTLDGSETDITQLITWKVKFEGILGKKGTEEFTFDKLSSVYKSCNEPAPDFNPDFDQPVNNAKLMQDARQRIDENLEDEPPF